MNTPPQVRLTQTVQKGGCAAKVAAHELRKILSSVRFPPGNSSLLVDGGLFDYAAIYKVTESLALVQTLDFFTPILDSPQMFGKVACANALSDVYAMGGTPQTAMAILAFPLATMESDVASQVLQGACDVLSEAKVPLVGGHSIDDDTLKFGLSVTGYVHPDKVWSNNKARSGDVLILTKGLGTGAITAGLKRSELTESDMQEALDSMIQINQVLDLFSPDEELAIHAATDITGFGFLGHSVQMAKASQKSFEIQAAHIPRLKLAEDCLKKGFLTKAHRTNTQYVDADVTVNSIDVISRLLLVDPQTSGGLLLSVDEKMAERLLGKLKTRFPRTAFVGKVLAPTGKAVTVR